MCVNNVCGQVSFFFFSCLLTRFYNSHQGYKSVTSFKHEKKSLWLIKNNSQIKTEKKKKKKKVIAPVYYAQDQIMNFQVNSTTITPPPKGKPYGWKNRLPNSVPVFHEYRTSHIHTFSKLFHFFAQGHTAFLGEWIFFFFFFFFFFTELPKKRN